MAGTILTTIEAGSVPTLAFLFTDIEGSTARWERFTGIMGEAVARHDRLLAETVVDAGGSVFKFMGDGLAAVFPRADLALGAALRIQQKLAATDFSAVDGLYVRTAIHYGPAERRDDDYFGPTLNRTARLMGLGHGGQILASHAAIAAVNPAALPDGTAVDDLGTHRLRDLLEPERVYQLSIQDLSPSFPPLRSLDAQPNNLPIQASAFIGRETEIDELQGLIGNHRLVSLLGTGGIGKSRLSLQVGAEQLHAFVDGVWFIELAGLTEAVQVAPLVAALFDITLNGATPITQLATALRDRKTLLILDNCEHLVAGVAELVAELLARCPGVTLLATSRVALNVSGEYRFDVPTLALPPMARGLSASAAQEYSAIRLFVDRAGLATFGFVLDDTTASDIAEICIRLDGIALAIELAAARIRMLRPGALLGRLNDRFRLLNQGPRTALPRHQTLRAMIDWSHDLLNDAERVALRRLGAFAGSFTIEGAETLVAGDPIARDDVFDLVTSLLDKSLIVRLPQGDAENRFRLLETTRHYALDKLAEAGETDQVQRRLAVHMIAVFGTARETWPDTDAELWRAQYAPEQENLRAALDWTLRPESDPDLAIALAARLMQPQRAGLITRPESDEAVQAALLRLAPETPASDEAWVRFFGSIGSVGGYTPDLVSACRALDLFRATGDTGWTALVALNMAYIHIKSDPAAAKRHVEDARAYLPIIQENRIKSLVFAMLCAINCTSVANYPAAAGFAGQGCSTLLTDGLLSPICNRTSEIEASGILRIPAGIDLGFVGR